MHENRRKILCIEDDHEIAALIAEEFVERGFDVQVTHTGMEGFSAILKSLPDLVLADIGMPAASGFEVLERLAAAAPRVRNIPFIFLTAMSDPDVKAKALRLGADDFIIKPVDFDLLEAVIRARLAVVTRCDIWRKKVNMYHHEVEASAQTARGNRLKPQ
jgi:DNA-binding response OmpR family regulator